MKGIHRHALRNQQIHEMSMYIFLCKARKMLRLHSVSFEKRRVSGLLFLKGSRGELRPQLCATDKGQRKMTRQEIIGFCLTFPASYEDYPFDTVTDAGAWAVMRHR